MGLSLCTYKQNAEWSGGLGCQAAFKSWILILEEGVFNIILIYLKIYFLNFKPRKSIVIIWLLKPNNNKQIFVYKHLSQVDYIDLEAKYTFKIFVVLSMCCELI